MSARPLEESLWWMKSIAWKGSSDFARTFAKSMLRHGRRPDWKPTPRQARVMEGLIVDHIAGDAGEAEPELIEADR